MIYTGRQDSWLLEAYDLYV